MAQLKPVSFAAPTEYSAEEESIKRQQALAQYLRQQADQPLPQGQMVSGWYVPSSPLEGLAKGLRSFGARKFESEAEERKRALAKRSQQDYALDRQRLVSALRGTPEQPASEDAASNYLPPQPAVAPNPQAIEQMNFRSPMFQQLQMSQLMNQIEPRKPLVIGRSAIDPVTHKTVAIDPTVAQERMERIEAKKAELAQRHEFKMQELVSQNASREQMAREQRAFQESMAKLTASLRTPPQEQVLQTAEGPMRLVKGQAIPITDQSGQPVKAPSGRAGQMSATAQKELIETEEQLQGGQQALSFISNAKNVNDKAMGFAGAGIAASVGSLLPQSVRPEIVDATMELTNIVQNTALPQLKAIFGGMPTEGERKILLEMQGSASQPPNVRKGIFERAEKAVQARLKFSQEKAKRLREGTYFTGEGLPSIGGTAPVPPDEPPPGAVRQR